MNLQYIIIFAFISCFTTFGAIKGPTLLKDTEVELNGFKTVIPEGCVYQKKGNEIIFKQKVTPDGVELSGVIATFTQPINSQEEFTKHRDKMYQDFSSHFQRMGMTPSQEKIGGWLTLRRSHKPSETIDKDKIPFLMDIYTVIIPHKDSFSKILVISLTQSYKKNPINDFEKIFKQLIANTKPLPSPTEKDETENVPVIEQEDQRAFKILQKVNDTLDPKRKIRDAKNITYIDVTEGRDHRMERTLVVEGKDNLALTIKTFDKKKEKYNHEFVKVCNGVNSWEVEGGEIQQREYDADDRNRYTDTFFSMLGLIELDKISKAEFTRQSVTVNGVDCYDIRIKEKKGRNYTVFIDKEKSLMVKVKIAGHELTFNKYGKVGSSQYISEAVGQIIDPESKRTLRIELNKELPLDTFAKPAIKETEENSN